MLLEKLCNADGVSGCEREVRELIKEEAAPFADDIITDSMGNLLVLKKGIKHDKTVMLSAHMDEVGFIISGITKEGYLEFKSVGGIDTRVIISKKVRIGKDRIKGIIGIKAVHLTTRDERDKVPKESELFIDIGAKDMEDAKKYIKLGDYAAFDTEFELLGENSIKAKAIDDRVGCYILCKLMKEKVEYDTWFCFCTQEEVGLRGARIAAYRIKPDIALVIEGTTCCDVPGADKHEYVTEMNGGAAISFMDRTTIVNKKYCDWLMELAEKKGINAQYKKMASGGNDAGVIHLSETGVLCASVSVPCRYIHSPASVASLKDIEAVSKLCSAVMENINDIINVSFTITVRR